MLLDRPPHAPAELEGEGEGEGCTAARSARAGAGSGLPVRHHRRIRRCRGRIQPPCAPAKLDVEGEGEACATVAGDREEREVPAPSLRRWVRGRGEGGAVAGSAMGEEEVRGGKGK